MDLLENDEPNDMSVGNFSKRACEMTHKIGLYLNCTSLDLPISICFNEFGTST